METSNAKISSPAHIALTHHEAGYHPTGLAFQTGIFLAMEILFHNWYNQPNTIQLDCAKLSVQLSDKIVLTPPYPGNRRGAVWAETRYRLLV